ncbi:MAG: HEAT repeat domain-containing protein [Blastocatellia bacterium]|nr:HEAT repeat domain-containing protein [Blastocatellia bacterium]
MLSSRYRLRAFLICVGAALGLAWFGLEGGATQGAGASFKATLQFEKPWERQFTLREGETIEVSVGMPRPSLLPAQGRIGVAWTLVRGEGAAPAGVADARKPDAFGIYAPPTANWRKVLHALDPDVYLVYRAPVAGEYRLELAPVTDEAPIFEGARWREEGCAPQATVFPRKTPWPVGRTVPLTVNVAPIDLRGSEQAGMHIEQEPNDTPETAQRIVLPEGEGIRAVRISGGADDIEYFDNGAVGRSGDDWFQLVYNGREPRLVTCDLTIPDHTLAAQLRMYALDGGAARIAESWPRPLLPIVEYTEGRNENERIHQQNEGHRAAIVRLLKPGGVYFLRAEANAPGYEVELRVLKPAPYADPRMAVRQAMYDHLGQVDSWLTNRPRGASVERRIRDSGNLMGTHCMSCHTQSGVWGPVVPMENGYRPENIQHFRRLVNTMYESLRPTNYLKDAANNTSLAPLDIGDGPAGTRVTGHAVCTAERVAPARKLHSKQAWRAANHVLQTADPSGINAAGPGSNVGQSVVYSYSGEILRTAWDRTGHPRYLAAIEEKAERMLGVLPRYSDDLSHRIEFFKRFFPQDYLAQSRKARATQKTLPPEPPEPPAPKPSTDGKPVEPPPARFPRYQLLEEEAAAKLVARIEEQIAKDEARLRAIQNADGSWGFDPGKTSDGGRSWKTDGLSDPAPTALALIALQAMGRGPGDPSVDRGVQALLRVQDPYGRWNKAAQTGFVTTAYSMHALARLFPAADPKPARAEFVARPGESLPAAVARVRALSHSDDPALLDLMMQAATHASPWVRTWGVMGLGAVHQERGVPTLIRAMGDPVKMVRDAAAWAMEQTLLDDAGFDAVFAAFDTGSDLTRESVLKALGIRADAVLTEPRFNRVRLTDVLARALNDDPHPGVRAWAARAAWQWWVWNPPTRAAIQTAWTKKLLAAESNALVENCFRYQSHALFVANGHKANGSEEHQYKELTALFKSLEARLDDPALDARVKDRLARRLVTIAATYYNTSGGDGGPGQMGYITPGSSEMMGKAAVHLWNRTGANDLAELRLVLEGASGVGFPALQDRIIDYSTHGPESLRTLAAAAVSDPSTVTLPATEEKVGPLVEQIFRGAQDYDRRQTLAAPVMRLLARANWAVPKTTEQREILYSLLIPKFEKEPNSAEIDRILTAAADSVKPMGQQNAEWYIADRMGPTLAANPDLHNEVLLRHLPGAVRNPLIGHFWLPSVRWVTDFGDGVPEIDAASAPALPQEVTAARARAVDLYLQMLRPEAPHMTRSMALRMANLTALRRNPAVRAALKTLAETEKDGGLAQAAKNVVRATDPEAWMTDLREAVRKEPLAAAIRDAGGEPQLSPQFLASFRYFSDYVSPELNRPQRMDEMSCLRCHGVRGRVPSMELEPADGNGYWTMNKMLKNYLVLQQRVNLADIETSKLLRKPLNVQTGKEDGHQGGRRYTPGERGYQVFRRWVLDQPRVQQGQGAQSGTR